MGNLLDLSSEDREPEVICSVVEIRLCPRKRQLQFLIFISQCGETCSHVLNSHYGSSRYPRNIKAIKLSPFSLCHKSRERNFL